MKPEDKKTMRYFIPREVINKFLETNYPRGRAIGVFRSFHFGLKAQKPKFIYYTSPKTAKAVLTSPQGEVEAETPRQSLEEFF